MKPPDSRQKQGAIVLLSPIALFGRLVLSIRLALVTFGNNVEQSTSPYPPENKNNQADR